MLTFTGTVAGYRVQEFPARQGKSAYTKRFLGFTNPQINKYGKPVEVETELEVSQNSVDAAMQLAANYKDQKVRVPVYITAWVGKGGASYNLMFSGQDADQIEVVS